ncbi:MAG: hypothetical protein U1F68_19405 [Gammaproteobacteria bacterium]
MPRGDFLLVPFFCDGFVGEPIYWNGNHAAFVNQLETTIQGFAAAGRRADWD